MKDPAYHQKYHTRYVPLSQDNYTIFLPYRQYSPLPPENILVNHISQTIARRSTIRDPAQDAIDDLMKDRMGLIRSKIELILLQLEERKKINVDVLSRIDTDSTVVQNLIFGMGFRAYGMDKDRITLERMKLDLESQKRMEQTSYFRDTGFLNTDLKDTLIQYLNEVQKSSLLTGTEEL
jgi:hypothetical protein